VGHDSFDGFDEIGDEVVSAFELDINLRPCVHCELAHFDELVVHRNEADGEQEEDDEEGDGPTHSYELGRENEGQGCKRFIAWLSC
jgi:hypothetical protein